MNTRARKNPLVTGIHIGRLVADKMKQQRMSNAEVARLLNRDQATVTTLMKRPSLHVYILWEFSIALGYNFFHHLSEQLITKTGEKIVSSIPTDKMMITTLQQEVQRLTEERDYLKKMINILDKK
jgi:hypothetical protein